MSRRLWGAHDLLVEEKGAQSWGDKFREGPCEVNLGFLSLKSSSLRLNTLGENSSSFWIQLNQQQVLFQFVFISTLWLVLSGLWALRFLILGNESLSKCKQMRKVPVWPSVIHSNTFSADTGWVNGAAFNKCVCWTLFRRAWKLHIREVHSSCSSGPPRTGWQHHVSSVDIYGLSGGMYQDRQSDFW